MESLIQFVVRRRSELVMCALIALMLASPLADTKPRVGGVIALLIFLLLLFGASYMASRGILVYVGLPIGGLWIISRILEAVGDSRHFYTHLSPIFGLALSITILSAILKRFGVIPLVTASVISEAFISYLVIAIAFSQIYWILIQVCDHAFNQVILTSQSSELLYFSMITLSSVGYGGILPINPFVRLVAAIESMIGVFYIAVIVARLVSSYRPRGRRETEHF
jgi:hypothetical protein